MLYYALDNSILINILEDIITEGALKLIAYSYEWSNVLFYFPQKF